MPKPSTHGGSRKGAGRVQQYGAPVRVRLTDGQKQIAKKLGEGDISAGIRTALEMSVKNKSENSGK